MIMPSPLQILEQYWGFTEFREPQEAVISSVLKGQDTLALLPTGGGKSVCFQVPAMMQDGVCVVISPLIALMKDQVMQLKERHIKAEAVFSGLRYNEIDRILDNAVFGYYKFLYVSPERLKTEIFMERFAKMPVSLIAVDEAHCVSQWGYDFRPPYLEIAEIRKIHPRVPFIALTASATPLVQNDILDKLQFKNPAVYKKSFLRENISFVVRHEEAKLPKLVEIIKNLKGNGIIYVRNRKMTKDVSGFLQQHLIKADFYHAGLNTKERSRKQDDWVKNKIQAIVCTNAFGMGIDKADVQFVVHLDIPESLEAYYQEAGRAGRNGKKAYAILLYRNSDKENLQLKLDEKFPDIELVKKVYSAVCNYLGIASGSGKFITYEFELNHFCKSFKLDSSLVYNSLKILEQEEYLQLSEGFGLSSRLIFQVDNFELYKFQVAHAAYDPLIKTLLRSYGGILDHYTKIDEKTISGRLKISETELQKQLKFLQQHKLVSYFPASDKPMLTLLEERLPDSSLRINTKYLNQRKKVMRDQLDAVVGYVESREQCRQQRICQYFGDTVLPCGKCDVCLDKQHREKHHKEFELAKTDLLKKISREWVAAKKLIPQQAHYREELYKEVMRYLLDEKLLELNDKNELRRVG
jgi:ATP-dependent DNA helicase RecQ